MKKHLLLFLVLLLTGFAANAQSRCFKAYDRLGREVTKFCIGERITFRDCAGVDADKEYYDYDKRDGLDFNTPEAKQKYHTFTTAGPVTVTQLGNLNGRTEEFSQTFEVVDTPSPTFTVTACANKTFRFQITDAHYDYYTINFGDGTSSPPITKQNIGNPVTHRYTQAGPHNVKVTGKYVGGFCNSPEATQTINDLPAYTSPVINTLKVQKQDATTGTIDFTFSNLLQGYSYTLKSKTETETNYKPVATIAANQTSYTLANTNTASKTEFILEATDACSTVLPTSNKATIITLTTTGGNEQVTINWQTIAGFFKQYDLYRNGILLQSVAGNSSSYTDTDVSCGQNNCYEIKGITMDGKSTTVSVQSCIAVTSTSTPPAATLLTSFNPQNEIEITLQLPNGQSIKSATYQRSINGAAFKDIANTQQTTISDKLSAISTVCYRATYTNPCDKTAAASALSCPVILTAKLTPEETAQLTWTNYTGFTNGATSYTLEVLDETGGVVRSIKVSGNSYSDQLAAQQEQVFRYRIKATSGSGTVTYSNTQTIKLELALFVPSAFTPNNDGLNDVFEVKGKRFENFSIRIINSAGQVVYTSDNRATGWDGNVNGKLQPAGVYAYEITVSLQDGSTKRRTGTVTLLR
ncbi:gliding motility-associated C-terminal domain-containing protein [Pontibacter fetidus]|uniref:Gliding motility-associated C-terminal domain-containing protein n=1 Tax=Pontibacter fetidus TaxID=2700082 RepID=A0A6B2GYS9_9BACT|nr:gliding motility-associated C-terminal domain-containing protein [Pontibacter fetidus]NDK56025.1 gliding motility-associated C-terminal domain-containing protein [Pontibacter fetidus]